MTNPSPQSSYAPDAIALRHEHLRTIYGERDSDIYISGYSRSGTTWTHLILYQLTTDGNMDFDHIFHVSPWLFYNAMRGTEPPNPPEPRILKTHDNYKFFPKSSKGRFIYVVRDGRDALVSFYHHRVNVKGFAGSFDDHFNEFVYGMEYNGHYYNWFEHVKDWVENKSQLPIFYVRYESLKQDFDNTIKKIVEFCDIPVTDEVLRRTRERTTFAFMKEQQLKLGPSPTQFRETTDAPYKVKNQAQFIRKGNVGEGKLVLTSGQNEVYLKKFHEVLGHINSLADYGK